jgi:hypothetical protein
VEELLALGPSRRIVLKCSVMLMMMCLFSGPTSVVHPVSGSSTPARYGTFVLSTVLHEISISLCVFAVFNVCSVSATPILAVAARDAVAAPAKFAATTENQLLLSRARKLNGVGYTSIAAFETANHSILFSSTPVKAPSDVLTLTVSHDTASLASGIRCVDLNSTRSAASVLCGLLEVQDGILVLTPAPKVVPHSGPTVSNTYVCFWNIETTVLSSDDGNLCIPEFRLYQE